jgi:hypothetical protein
MAVTRKRSFDYTVTIDGQPVRLKIKRLTVPEFEEFESKFLAMGQGRGSPIIEPAQRLDGTAPQTPITRELLDAQAAYLVANAEWLQTVFDQYVTVAAGDVLDEDDTGAQIVVTNGKQFADMYAGLAIPAQVLARIYLENKLTDEQKKRLPSPSASETGSPIAAASAVPGAPPAPTVTPADSVGSADPAGATAPFNDTSSGMTAH